MSDSGPTLQHILEPITLRPKLLEPIKKKKKKRKIKAETTSEEEKKEDEASPDDDYFLDEGTVILEGEDPNFGGVDDGEEEDDEEGRLEIMEGRFKISEDQFLPAKYIYIPGKMMLDPKLFKGFAVVLKEVIDLMAPAIMFKLNKCNDSSTWNVRLPPSRHKLSEIQNRIASGDLPTGGGYVPNLQGAIDHYQGVLAQNCQRLLRTVQVGAASSNAVYQLQPVWSDDCPVDYFADWVSRSCPKGPNPLFMGLADKADFHPEVWADLKANCVFDFDNQETKPDCVMIDSSRWLEGGDRKVEYDKKTGAPRNSYPHPNLTHLIISDNRELLEAKFYEMAPWAVLLMNGLIPAAKLAVQAIQLEKPLIVFKYSGGAADLVVEMYDVVDKFVNAKRAKQLNDSSVPPTPFLEDMVPDDFKKSDWLFPFDADHVACCNIFNVLVENWPDRHTKISVFIIDIFATSEDDVQDKLTQSIQVAFKGEYELGGDLGEQKRLSYALRIRHKFIYNASMFKIKSDLLQTLAILLGMASTLAAVLYAFYNKPNGDQKMLKYLSMASLVLPLLTTVIKGIYAAMSPYLKYVALKNASVQIESEVYSYRMKVGSYSTVKQADDEEEDDKKKKKKKKDEEKEEEEGGDDAAAASGGPNPRKNFMKAMDKIWAELAGSDLQSGSLALPQFTSDSAALEDINSRIRANRTEQLSYLMPIPYRNGTSKPSTAAAPATANPTATPPDTGTPAPAPAPVPAPTPTAAAASSAEGLDSSKVQSTDAASEPAVAVAAGSTAATAAAMIALTNPKQVMKIETVFDLPGDLLDVQRISHADGTKKLVFHFQNPVSLDMFTDPFILTDDGISTMSADEYVQIRILPFLAQFSKQSPQLNNVYTITTVLGVILSVFTALLGQAFSAGEFVPLVNSVNDGMTAYVNYQQVQLRMLQTNLAINQLSQALVWWDSLTMIEKRNPQQKGQLVKKVESCLQGQATIFQGGGGSNDDSEEDDEKKEDK